jgi:glyoxylase-like metal-dependent hydrolase (beta-lactamase superfamily II)
MGMRDAEMLGRGPREGDIYEVYGLCYARGRTRRTADNFLKRGLPDGPMAMNYNIWVLRNERRTVVVDTGMSAQTSTTHDRPMDVHPVEALRRVGVDPQTVEDVILSHMHWDHGGNIDAFPNARFHVQRDEVAFVTGWPMSQPELRWAYAYEDIAALIKTNYDGRVRVHAGDAAPFSGVTLHHLPGHAPGLQAVRVNTARGSIVLALDVAHYFANLLRRQPFSLTLDWPASLRSYERLLELSCGELERIVPGHDSKTPLLYPSLRVGGVDLMSLHQSPKRHDPDELASLQGFPLPEALS